VPVDEKNSHCSPSGAPRLADAPIAPSPQVTTLVPAVVAASGTVTANFLSPTPGVLLPEMTVSVEVEVARKPGALALPLEAVRDLARVPGETGTGARRTRGRRGCGGDHVEILSGPAPATGSSRLPRKVAAGDRSA
jgi:HlyD family secretion protein